jgi:hypothetical protein
MESPDSGDFELKAVKIALFTALIGLTALVLLLIAKRTWEVQK